MNNRYEFIFLFDVKDANPNGDPDAGNLPRVDAETGHGLLTDVCIKRKIRNFVTLLKADQPLYEIYVKEKAVLNRLHERAYTQMELKPEAKKLPKDVEKAQAVTKWMCHNFYDIRAFGAVMTTEVNSGQVRGPVQIAFSRSIDPIVVSEHSITRMAVTNEKDLEKERTMGRKFTVPYALYRTHGFVNPFLARDTGFSEDDLELFFQALENAFQFDASAARPAGSMSPRALLVFKHDTALGKAPSHTLFEKLQITSFSERAAEDGKPARAFSDYGSRISFDGVPLDDVVQPGGSKDLGNGITLQRRI